MKKLTTMFAMASMVTALAVGGCRRRAEEERRVEPVTKTTEPGAMGTTGGAALDTTHPAAELPTECVEYKAAIDTLAGCDKLPQESRDALKQNYEQTAATWKNLTPEQKPALATACKSATDAVKQAAASCL
jgi:catalase